MSQRKAFVLGVAATLFVILVTVFLIAIISNSNNANNTSSQAEKTTPTYKPATADEIYTLVNQERGKAGLQPLIRMKELDASAQFKADDMANRNYLTHEDPVTGKNNGLDKAIELTGDRCKLLSENFHYGEDEYKTTQGAIDWWLGSESHRNAMLDPEYVYTGVGVSSSGMNNSIQVQHFCKTK